MRTYFEHDGVHSTLPYCNMLLRYPGAWSAEIPKRYRLFPPPRYDRSQLCPGTEMNLWLSYRFL